MKSSPHDARVLVCCATANEARSCAAGARAAGVEVGQFFEVLETGMGFVRAERALRARLAKGSLPGLIVSSGVAGSLSTDLSLYDWITASQVFRSDRVEGVREIGIPKLRVALAGTSPCSVVSADELVVPESQNQKRDSSSQKDLRQSVAVDMESAVLGQVAAETGVAFMVLRLISDTPENPLPTFAAEFASAFASTSLSDRLVHGARGVSKAARDLKGVIRMTKEPRTWARLLRDGWRSHAPLLLR